MFQPGKYNFSVLVCLVVPINSLQFCMSVCKYNISVEGKFFDNFFVEVLSSYNTDMIVDR